ncbi:hypothetical protein NX059_012286 [Plenodomus lindquistii]|nr:hypothetical protein NX059_012286 [Plenodomus lindquistii]
MAAGKTPGGTALRAGAVPFAKVFGAGGIFQQNWPSATYTSLQLTYDWFGNINDLFTSLLGRTADAGLQNRFVDNLQVCGGDFNVYKVYMVAGLDFVLRPNWNSYNAQDQVGILLDVVDMHDYRGREPRCIAYDFQDAWKQTMPDYLAWQMDRIRDTFDVCQ